MSKNPKNSAGRKAAKKEDRKPRKFAGDIKEIKYCRIYPGLGIARVGNSPDEFFIGPESPGCYEEPEGGYKDSHGRVKRQGARFRVYAYGEPQADGTETVLGELTAKDADIIWHVHLANKKADWYEFRGSYRNPTREHPDQRFINMTEPRNQQMPGQPGDESRRALVIDPGPRTITGRNQKGVRLDGTFGPLPLVEPPPPNMFPGQGFNATIFNGPIPESVRDSIAGAKGAQRSQSAESESKPEKIKMSRKVDVHLGELRTDEAGRLIVLGGHGKSATVWDNEIGTYPNYPANDQFYFSNNDFWHDDTSDGPITAHVTLKDGRHLEVRGSAWVLVAPPKFAPAHINLTTLYETAEQAAREKFPEKFPSDDKVYFMRDIYPILKRLDDLQWVNKTVYRGHGPDSNGSFLSPDMLKRLASKTDEGTPPGELRPSQLRRSVFKRIRNPHLKPGSPEAARQDNYDFMPQMFGDNGEPSYSSARVPQPEPGAALFQTLLTSQYDKLERWARGDFEEGYPPDWVDGVELSQLPADLQPRALDRAALHPCVGGPFFPGIEMTYIATFEETWSEPFRINDKVYEAGDITKFMALPWQADFYECNLNWWPAQRPDDIVTESEYNAVLPSYDPSVTQEAIGAALADRILWARGLPDPNLSTSYPRGDNMMVKHWYDLGFVVPREGPKGPDGEPQTVYIETERGKYDLLSDREYFYLLMNIETYPDFLPKAHQLAEMFLKQAWQNQEEADPDERWKFFEYTPEAYDARLNDIYNDFVRDANSDTVYEEDLGDTTVGSGTLPQTRQQAIAHLINMAPFNMIDGAWLRHAAPAGPIDKVQAMIFSIYMDEMGDGNVQQQHCNVYNDTLKSVNVYLPDIHTRAFAENPQMLDSAFTLPVFTLAISLFPDDFYPELLGMTLQLEWEAQSLVPVVDKLNAFGIDPIYYVLHVGIDNAASGHGAIAKKAVEMYLDFVRENDGEEAMQRVWKRIWNGYVAFGTIGTLGQDEYNLWASDPTPNDAMINLILSKAPYGSLNHRDKMLGSNFINDWFEDQQGFLDELVKSGLVIPGRPDISPIFELMSFNGPMYHVFTEDEQQLWRDWVVWLAEKESEKFDLVKQMIQLINFMRERQQGNTGHDVLLKGPNPHWREGGKEDERFVTRSIHWWFDLDLGSEEANAVALMKALATEENGWIKVGDAPQSPIVTAMLSGNNDMAVAFRSIAPGSAGRTYNEILVMWIDNGCPTAAAPKVKPVAVAAEAGTARTRVVEAKPKRRRRKIWGQGRVH